MQILTKRIIFDADGEMVDYELISTFVHLCSILQDLSAPGSGDGSSEHVRSGVLIFQKPPTRDVERFLSILRFVSRGKVNALGRYADPEVNKTGM